MKIVREELQVKEISNADKFIYCAENDITIDRLSIDTFEFTGVLYNVKVKPSELYKNYYNIYSAMFKNIAAMSRQLGYYEDGEPYPEYWFKNKARKDGPYIENFLSNGIEIPGYNLNPHWGISEGHHDGVKVIKFKE